MEKKEKKEELKESQTSSSSFSLMFGNQKLTRAQKKYKKYKKSLKSIKNKNIRTNVIFLYELTIKDNNEFKQKYALDRKALGQKKLNYYIECYNKIREIINSKDQDFIDKYIFENDREAYQIEDEKENILNANSINNNIQEEKKDNINNIQTKANPNNNINNVQNDKNNKIKTDKNNKKEEINEISPIKKFWKISLINCQFFYISKRDAEILNYLEDIIFISLDYPDYKIEFHFKENKFFQQKILYKEYYYFNYKKEKLKKSMGCDIEWEDDDTNPTLKLSKKKLKEKKEVKCIKNKKRKIKENPYVNCSSFFNMFDIDKCTIEKDLIEANFFVDDFLPNILEYYLNIIEIKYENEEDELLSNN